MREDFLAAIVDHEDDCEAWKAELASISVFGEITKNCTIHMKFADWLEEHGEPEQAELIRLHCELISNQPLLAIAEADKKHNAIVSRVVDNKRYEAIRRREKELLSHDFAIAYPLDTWERGLVVRWKCDSAAMIRYVPSLMKKFPIRTVELTEWLGIDRSLPPEPAKALPWLRTLIMPRLSWHSLEPTQEIKKLFEPRKIAVQIKEPISASGFGYYGEEITLAATLSRHSPEEYIRAAERAFGAGVEIDENEVRDVLDLPRPTAPDTSR